jgi:hypothetical protein
VETATLEDKVVVSNASMEEGNPIEIGVVISDDRVVAEGTKVTLVPLEGVALILPCKDSVMVTKEKVHGVDSAGVTREDFRSTNL